MAISLSSSIIKSNREKALKDLQKKASKAAKGESRRKGLSSILGTVGGMGLGALAAGLTGVTGGLALPLIMGLSSSAAKGLTDAASKGKFGKRFKTPGQTGKITSGSEYGYGREEAGDIQEALQESRDATSWTPQSMLEDVALSYLSAGVGGKLKGVGKDVMGGNFSKAITGVDNYSLADNSPIAQKLFASKVTKQGLADNPFLNESINDFWNFEGKEAMEELPSFSKLDLRKAPITMPEISKVDAPSNMQFLTDDWSGFTVKRDDINPYKYYGGGKVNTNNNTLYDYFKAFENGGMIPKYKKGGGIFGFGKKGKEPERDEALMVLDTILSSQLPKGEYKRKGRGGNTIRQDVMPYSTDKGQSRWKGRQIAEFDTTEGTRYYAGEGTSQDMQVALTKAMMNAFSRKELSPADSITTDQLAKLKELGLFMGGGKVGMDNSNTLYDYFAAQGKTMGGSDTMSIAQKLGRR